MGDYWNEQIQRLEERIGRDDAKRPHLENLLSAAEADPAQWPDELKAAAERLVAQGVPHDDAAINAALDLLIGNREDVLATLLLEQKGVGVGMQGEDRQIDIDRAIYDRLAKRVRKDIRRYRDLTGQLKPLVKKEQGGKKLTAAEKKRKQKLIGEQRDVARGLYLLTGVDDGNIDPNALPRGAESRGLESRITADSPLGRAWEELGAEKGRRDTLADVAKDLPGRIQEVRDELHLGPNSLYAQRGKKRDPTADNAALAELQKTRADNALANLRLSEGTLGVLSGFDPADLLGGLGGFAHGIQNVPRDGYALLHKSETVLPAPDGPYGHQLRPYQGQQPPSASGGPATVQITLSGDVAGIVRVVDARIDGKTAAIVQTTNRNLGRDSRQVGTAPGR
jgi:hypothetical protein